MEIYASTIVVAAVYLSKRSKSIWKKYSLKKHTAKVWYDIIPLGNIRVPFDAPPQQHLCRPNDASTLSSSPHHCIFIVSSSTALSTSVVWTPLCYLWTFGQDFSRLFVAGCSYRGRSLETDKTMQNGGRGLSGGGSLQNVYSERELTKVRDPRFLT